MTHSIISKYTTKYTVQPISEDDFLATDLGLDEVDLAGIAQSIWEEHGLEVPDAEIAKWQRVGDISACVEQLRAA